MAPQVWRTVKFAAGMAVAAGVAAPLGYAVSGRNGVYCVLLAAGVCGFVGLAALAVQEVCRNPQQVLLHVAAGFLLRMGVPLGVCVVVYLENGPLARAGFAFYLLVFYLLALAGSAALSLPGRAPPAR